MKKSLANPDANTFGTDYIFIFRNYFNKRSKATARKKILATPFQSSKKRQKTKFGTAREAKTNIPS